MPDPWLYSVEPPWLVLSADHGVCYISQGLERYLVDMGADPFGQSLTQMPSPLDDPALAEAIDRTWEETDAEGQIFAGAPDQPGILIVPLTLHLGLGYTVLILIEPSQDGLSGGIPSLFNWLREQRERDSGQTQLSIKEHQLIQSEKMAAIGQLAAGVAHEINNPMGYIGSNLNTLTGYVADLTGLIDAIDEVDTLDDLRALKTRTDYDYVKGDIHACINESIEGANRVRDIIAALRDYSHADDNTDSLLDLADAFATTLKLVHNEVKYHCQVHQDYSTIPPVHCNPGQIKQVMVNLILNAAQAIRAGGNIWLRLGQADDRPWFEIEDDGHGIAAGQLEHIFEPFYTTKPVGQGTGLGLALSYGIVERHDGRIEVESTEGRGSRFRVWLSPQTGTG